jgi:hypothetical protein
MAKALQPQGLSFGAWGSFPEGQSFDYSGMAPKDGKAHDYPDGTFQNLSPSAAKHQ